MIVIPSVSVSSDVAPARAQIDEWAWLGYQRTEVSLGVKDAGFTNNRLFDQLFRDIQCPAQLAGGFQSGDDVESALVAGASLVVLGPRALDDPDWMRTLTDQFPEQLLVSVPARERRTRTRGAVRTMPHDLRDLASELSSVALAGMIVTFMPEDEIGHSELALLEDVVEEVGFQVLVSGSSPTLTTLRDLEFRGVAATVISAAHLSATFDGQVLARSFTD